MLTEYPQPKADAGSKDAIWIDLLSPTAEEMATTERRFNLRIPSRKELTEVESSSRVSQENGTLLLNMPAIAPLATVDLPPAPLGFILKSDVLVTLRYAELRTFNVVAKKVLGKGTQWTSVSVFSAIVDEMVDLNADLLEGVASELESTSRGIFSKATNASRQRPASNAELRELLTTVGHAGEHLARISDSILSLQRIVTYVGRSTAEWIPGDVHTSLATAGSDLASLDEYETHLTDKVQFLLDAVLGFVNIKQNDIFQMLTVISVVGIPPTLVASIYGMNFRNMPELTWTFGYQYALLAILASAFLPLVWFRWKKWV